MIKNMNNAVHYEWGGVCDGWRLLNRDDLSVIQERIPPGAGEVKHYHLRARQLFYVLTGQLAIEMQDQELAMSPGDSLEVAPGEAHRVRNTGDTEVFFLVISAPTTQGDRINV